MRHSGVKGGTYHLYYGVSEVTAWVVSITNYMYHTLKSGMVAIVGPFHYLKVILPVGGGYAGSRVGG